MTTLQLKYEKLDPAAQKEVDDFVDFLLTKKKKKTPFDMAEFKKRLLEAPTWSDDDVKEFEENIKLMTWKSEECSRYQRFH